MATAALSGIAPDREIQVFNEVFTAEVNAFGVAETIKTSNLPLIVPSGRFWFPISCYMWLRSADMPITTEEYDVNIEDDNAEPMYLGQDTLAVDAFGAAVWPSRDARTGAAYTAVGPFLMKPDDRFRMRITAGVVGDLWNGRFNYVQILGSNTNRAWELYNQWKAGTRRISMNFEQRRGK